MLAEYFRRKLGIFFFIVKVFFIDPNIDMYLTQKIDNKKR